MWTNVNFVGGDLSVSGLKGNGSTKYLVSNFYANPSMTSSQDGGITIYNTDAANSGAFDASCALSAGAFFLSAYISNGGNHYWDCYNQGTDRIGPAADAAYAGYISFNRGTDLGGGIKSAIYTAKSTRAHTVSLSSVVAASGTRPGVPCGVFCHMNNVTQSGAISSHRYSFVAFHHGLTITESAAFYPLVQALRTALGGGFV